MPAAAAPATRKRLWHCHLALDMWDIGRNLIRSKFRNFFLKFGWMFLTDFLTGPIPMPGNNTRFQLRTWRICTMVSWSTCPLVPKQISGMGRNQGETHTHFTFQLPTFDCRRQCQIVDGQPPAFHCLERPGIVGPGGAIPQELYGCMHLLLHSRVAE